MSRRPTFQRESRPPIDSPAAKAGAVNFLCGARSLDHVTAASLAHTYRLTERTADYLLWKARKDLEGANG